MAGTQNANTTLVEVTSEQTAGVRKARQVLAVTVLAALFAIPAASAATTQPWQPVQTKQAVHALVLRGQALNRMYHLGSYAVTSAVDSPDNRAGIRGIGAQSTDMSDVFTRAVARAHTAPTLGRTTGPGSAHRRTEHRDVRRLHPCRRESGHRLAKRRYVRRLHPCRREGSHRPDASAGRPGRHPRRRLRSRRHRTECNDHLGKLPMGRRRSRRRSNTRTDPRPRRTDGDRTLQPPAQPRHPPLTARLERTRGGAQPAPPLFDRSARRLGVPKHAVRQAAESPSPR